ncbi:Six-hairpin glycosidase-like protein [Dichotomocladium elegans]|nr:Six-hairpin glycosidase-like protein [Dichotomocladium elegans]
MWFYEAQRSGKLPSNNRVPWRSDSALEDGSDHNVDLTGGYYDAGDYLKFTLPLAHTITVLAWGAIEWFNGYTKAEQSEYLRSTIRWGTDWLIKAHPEADVLYVGDGELDNNYWGPDTNIPTPRPSYRVTVDNPGTDVAAQTVAAFASSAYLFRNYLNDSNYADLLQSHAETLFSFTESSTPFQVYTDAVSASSNYYAASSYQTQLVLAALWMYRLTGETSYRDKASNYFDQYKLASVPVAIWDWSDQSGAVHVLGAAIDGTNTKYSQAATKYLNTITQDTSVCSYTAGGLLWCKGASEYNSLVPAQDIALLALLYSKVDPSKSEYVTFALNQINYLLGDNRMLTPYVCGVHMNSPHNPHHAGASGGSDINNIDTSPPEEKYILYGAIIGGPDKDDKFYDERNDWAQTEVALDYNAPFQGLVAYQLSQDSVADPPYASITEPRPYVTRTKPFAKWIIAVIVVVVVFVLAGIGYLVWRKRYSIMARIGNKQYSKPVGV